MKNSLYMKNLISISDLDKNVLESIISSIYEIKKTKINQLLKNKIVANCFFEPSTRTRLSFEAATIRQGGSVIGFDNDNNTSSKKGETLADSIKIISSYADAIVIRHTQEGAAQLASEFASVPIINAGDGANQHPSQTILDLYTIYETQKQIDNITVTFVGDLKYGRTVHSLVQALSFFNTKFIFISPDTLGLPAHILTMLTEKNKPYKIFNSLEEAIPESDILYMTRLQKERMDEFEYKKIHSKYILSIDMLISAKPQLKILHPLPRVDEISTEIDKTPFAYYFQQAKNGIYARMAILALLLNKTL